MNFSNETVEILLHMAPISDNVSV